MPKLLQTTSGSLVNAQHIVEAVPVNADPSGNVTFAVTLVTGARHELNIPTPSQGTFNRAGSLAQSQSSYQPLSGYANRPSGQVAEARSILSASDVFNFTGE